MKSRLRRELRIHRALSGLCCLATVSFIAMGLQASPQRNMGEITVERINVVEKDGRTRLVIAGSDRQADTVINGHVLGAGRKRPAGMIFFNDEGDEDGGLIYSGEKGNASASLTFDQYKQDQTLQLVYSESGGRRATGFKIMDRATMPMDEFFDKYNAAQQLPAGTERTAALAAIGATDNGASRVFVGKDLDGSSTITLGDQHGKPRLRMTVEANGAPSIQFLDDAGRVTTQLPSR